MTRPQGSDPAFFDIVAGLEPPGQDSMLGGPSRRSQSLSPCWAAAVAFLLPAASALALLIAVRILLLLASLA